MKHILIAAALSLGFGGTCLAGTIHANHHTHGSILAKAESAGHQHASGPAVNNDRQQNERGG